MVGEMSPVQTRALDRELVTSCSLEGLKEHLPLEWPLPENTPSSPKRQYRSWYVYPGLDLEGWERMSDFDLLLHLIDFSDLRPVLAQRLGWQSGRGWIPFDPVSMFLLSGWQITNHWRRSQVLKNLADPRYADYAQKFGFQRGVYPTEGGVRHFLTALGRHSEDGDEVVSVEKGSEVIQVAIQYLNQLIVQSALLIYQTGILSSESWEQANISPDGQIHDAASHMHCQAVSDTCYQPTSGEDQRPCPAKQKKLKGCDCNTPACVQICKRATPRDPDARFIWYSHSNQDTDKEDQGEGRYGYRSLPLRLADRQRRFSITLLDDVRPANLREEVPAAALLLQLSHYYPDLNIDVVAGDAGFGYDVFLHTVYQHLQARRVVALRSHDTDKDPFQWPLRGYDDKGRPVCAFGYAFQSNGFDHQRRRHKWFCAHACLHRTQPCVQLPDVVYPPPECPYQDEKHPNGRVINIAERFPDGSSRLVRDIPVDSPSWKALYHRSRCAVEMRNATFERWGLKRMPVFGFHRSKALIFLADVWDNLTTLARLIREASLASLEYPP
jgi:hypothetical protein